MNTQIENENSLNINYQTIIELLDQGKIRIVEKTESKYLVNIQYKKAILDYLKFSKSYKIDENSYDKCDLKFTKWTEEDFQKYNIRVIPGCLARKGSYIGRNVVLMKSFINIGAYIDDDTMIDTWASIGSCAQIGKRCHISAGVGIGGVLEPLNNNPVIIEDDVFIGGRVQIAEGIIVRKKSVISSGVNLTSSTKIIDINSDVIYQGEIPEKSLVVPGTYKYKNTNYAISCALIIKNIDENTKSKTSINYDLRK
ncbi:2,3,4,5-tetrahydropyridine-2,6-dicarboxylate N-succinyltransferase [Anaplasmataceae bacterium AB001_6]|nr:2,3,4,5-tetrahydropyridine-2,6-dicarboxylate N-succinyltransferase [Anaplasmataceae bacterium AB001_6]